MSTTIAHIQRYIDYLKNEQNLSITLHDRVQYGKLLNCSELAEYNLHMNPYCLYIKTNPSVWQSCVKSQDKLSDKLSTCGRFCGICQAGILEYVYPVSRDRLEGFICVSGYRPPEGSELHSKAMHKLNKLCAAYDLDRSSVLRMYNKYLRADLPDQDRLDTLIDPLCDMLQLALIDFETSDKILVQNEVKSSRDRLYYSICNHIRRNHNHKVDLDSLSRHLNFSKSYISHIFKSHCGMTINQYVNTLRISEAKTLLTATTLSIQEIALSIGYTDSNYFSAIFRSSVGVSPREYRASASR